MSIRGQRSALRGLIEQGAHWADSPEQVAAAADIVFTMVGFPADVRVVYFGDAGALRSLRSGSIAVDMTTTEPSWRLKSMKSGQVRGGDAVDAPVSGGDVGAQNAALSIMIGGDTDVVKRVTPLFEIWAKTSCTRAGLARGNTARWCNQIVIAGTMVGVCESLLYGYKAGLDLPTMLQSVGSGRPAAGRSRIWPARSSNDNFDPGFFVEHFIKDMGIALAEAERMNCAARPGPRRISYTSP